jgi:hypothetical protein
MPHDLKADHEIEELHFITHFYDTIDSSGGRFCIVPVSQIFLVEYNLGNIAFENPKDATFYELKWS